MHDEIDGPADASQWQKKQRPPGLGRVQLYEKNVQRNSIEAKVRTAPFDLILSRLKGVKANGLGRVARCPAHEDDHASLSINEGDDGRVLMKCFAGCSIDEIVHSLNLEICDLFPYKPPGGLLIPRNNGATLQQSGRTGCTLAEYAEAKKLPVEFLKKLGLSEITYSNSPAVRIPYRDIDGEERAVRFRKATDGPDRFAWKKGSKPFLYGLWRLGAPDSVVLVEGESDCHTLWHHEVPALGLPGAANWNEERDAPLLENVRVIYVVIEQDQGGETVKQWLAKSCLRDRVCLVNLGEHKDASALHVANPSGFRVRFQAALDAAIPFPEVLQEQVRRERDAAWSQCRGLASTPEILIEFERELQALGMVGETHNAKILYLALTSRFLPRPVSIALKGPSSGGKSFLCETVLKFFPEPAFYSLTAMSDRLLAYTEADLKNRFLVVFEAAGMASDFASYLMRSLLSEGRLIYEFVEKTTGGMKPRRIEKQGPTGLLVTTTQVQLHPENETRLLSLQVTDTADQTRNILQSLARDAQTEKSHETPTFERWLALQNWLTHAEHRVIIPYAEELAVRTKPLAVRLRRDFSALLALIKAHAILHQKNRERDPDGRIIASLQDFATVRELVGSIVAQGVGATVSKETRETVNAVKALIADGKPEVSTMEVALKLKLDKSAASRRIATAFQKGHLKNLEDRKGRPSRLVLADAMPEETEILPTVQELHCCSIDGGIRDAPRLSQTLLGAGRG